MLWRCTPEEAMAKIGGYTLALDMTDRQAQVLTGWDKKQFWDQRHWDVDHLKGEAKKKGHPWSVSKGWDTSLPVSPKVFSVSRGTKWKWFVFQVSKFLSASRHSGGVENPNELEVRSHIQTGSQTRSTFLVSNIFFFQDLVFSKWWEAPTRQHQVSLRLTFEIILSIFVWPFVKVIGW